MTINIWPGYVVANEGCYYWGWFTACEMQIWAVLPILVYLVEFKLPTILARLLLIHLFLFGMAVNFYILYSHNMSAGLFASQDINIFHLWLNKSYTKISSVIMGIWLARLYQSQDSSFKLNNYAALFLCLASFAVLGFVSTFPLSANKDPPSWSRLKSALSITLMRPAFCAAIICLIWLLWQNKSPFMKRLLSHRVWSILARISYSVYLVFPIVAAQFSSSMVAPLYLTYNEMFYQMFYTIICSFICGTFAYLIFERPIVNLILGGRRYKSSEKLEDSKKSLVE